MKIKFHSKWTIPFFHKITQMKNIHLNLIFFLILTIVDNLDSILV
jgi:hypothetical protein